MSGRNNLIRSPAELDLMRKSGLIAAQALKKAISSLKPGLTLKKVDQLIEEEIVRLGGKPAFKTVPGYYWSSCLALNDEVVHGIPRDITIKSGDILGVDLGVVYEGWYTDAAWSIIVDGNDLDKQKFLDVGEKALWAAVNQAVDQKSIGDISSALQQTVEGAGYAIVESLSGHGVGKSYHEEPEVPGFGKAGTGMILKSGMTIAVEAIYNMGTGEVYEDMDGWTIRSYDGSLSGLFEMTVIVGNKPEVLTDWRQL